MALAKRATTVVSTKGQVILPKPIRDSKGWDAGKELIVEETRDGVLLRAARPFAPTKPEDVFGCLNAKGKHPKGEDFANEVRRRARGRSEDRRGPLSFLSF
jgi:AbrB family looped-hinge helix DNA binding protein